MREDLTMEIELADGVSANVDGNHLVVKGPKGEVSKDLLHPRIQINVESGKITLVSKKASKKEKMLIRSFQAHIRNMVRGVQEEFTYKLKICSGHFPMNVAVSGNELVIKNFLGESVPRKVSLIEGSQVKIEGTDIIVTSPDREKAGQMAARIESACRITDRDRRIFQDGIYITEKAGKSVA